MRSIAKIGLSTVLLCSGITPNSVLASQYSLSSGAYIGAKGGYSSVANSCDNHYDNCDNSALGYGGFIGYSFLPWLGFELGGNDYGSYDANYSSGSSSTKVEADVKGYDASFRFSTPLGIADGLSAYLRLGASYMDINYQTEGYKVDKKWSPLGALGTAYKLTQSLSLQGEYQYLSDVGGSHDHFTTLGLSYQFGQKTQMTETTASKPLPEKIKKPKQVVPPVPVVTSVQPKSPVQSLPLDLKSVYFAFNSSKLNHESAASLDKTVKFLLDSHQTTVHVIGYTDSVGNRGYNNRLSEKRAKAVAVYLYVQGIKVDRVQFEGRGEAAPLDNKQTEEERRKSRRVDIIPN